MVKGPTEVRLNRGLRWMPMGNGVCCVQGMQGEVLVSGSKGGPGPASESVRYRIAALQIEFRRQLPDKLARLRDAWQKARTVRGRSQALKAAFDLAHTLKGSAATFGLNRIARIVSEVADVLNRALVDASISDGRARQIDRLLGDLDEAIGRMVAEAERATADESVSSARPVVVMSQDNARGAALVDRVRQLGHQVNNVSEPRRLPAALETCDPAALVLEITTPQCANETVRVLAESRCARDPLPPFILVCAQRDLEDRLPALPQRPEKILVEPISTEQLAAAVAACVHRSGRPKHPDDAGTAGVSE